MNTILYMQAGIVNSMFSPIKVTVEYKLEDGACVPLRVHTVVISVQHSETISLEEMRTQLKEVVIKVGRTKLTYPS